MRGFWSWAVVRVERVRMRRVGERRMVRECVCEREREE